LPIKYSSCHIYAKDFKNLMYICTIYHGQIYRHFSIFPIIFSYIIIIIYLGSIRTAFQPFLVKYMTVIIVHDLYNHNDNLYKKKFDLQFDWRLATAASTNQGTGDGQHYKCGPNTADSRDLQLNQTHHSIDGQPGQARVQSYISGRARPTAAAATPALGTACSVCRTVRSTRQAGLFCTAVRTHTTTSPSQGT